jgi:hypothetical protein
MSGTRPVSDVLGSGFSDIPKVEREIKSESMSSSMTIRHVIQRVVIGDFSTTMLLFDKIFDNWDGNDSATVSSIIKSYLQLSDTLGGGKFLKIVLEPIENSHNVSTTRLKSMLREVIVLY